jgi:hypothetical protein
MTRWVSLFAEIVVGIALIAVLGRRMDLHGLAVVLPACLVVCFVVLLAFTVQRRFLFWCGALGAALGAIAPKPRVEILYNLDSDPADRAVAWYEMISGLNLQGAFVGGVVGVVLGTVCYCCYHRIQGSVAACSAGDDDRT